MDFAFNSEDCGAVEECGFKVYVTDTDPAAAPSGDVAFGYTDNHVAAIEVPADEPQSNL